MLSFIFEDIINLKDQIKDILACPVKISLHTFTTRGTGLIPVRGN